MTMQDLVRAMRSAAPQAARIYLDCIMLGMEIATPGAAVPETARPLPILRAITAAARGEAPKPAKPAAAKPKARTPTKPPIKPRANGKWTQERRAILAQMYPRGDSLADVANAVNATAGAKATGNECAFMASRLGYRRPGKDWLTPEREALMRDLWNDRSLTLPQLRDRMAALPGPAMPVSATITYRASTMDLTKRGTPRGPRPAPDDDDAPLPAPALPPGILEEDLAEARQMMRKKDCGARHLADWFGWPLADAQRIAAEIRDEIASAARDRAPA